MRKVKEYRDHLEGEEAPAGPARPHLATAPPYNKHKVRQASPNEGKLSPGGKTDKESKKNSPAAIMAERAAKGYSESEGAQGLSRRHKKKKHRSRSRENPEGGAAGEAAASLALVTAAGHHN